MSALLNKDQIIQADDIISEIIEVPEWGGNVRIKIIKGTERNKLEMLTDKDGKTQPKWMEKYLSLCLVDENGKYLFDENDIDKLAEKSNAVIVRLFKEAARINAQGQKEVENLAKN